MKAMKKKRHATGSVSSAAKNASNFSRRRKNMSWVSQTQAVMRVAVTAPALAVTVALVANAASIEANIRVGTNGNITRNISVLVIVAAAGAGAGAGVLVRANEAHHLVPVPGHHPGAPDDDPALRSAVQNVTDHHHRVNHPAQRAPKTAAEIETEIEIETVVGIGIEIGEMSETDIGIGIETGEDKLFRDGEESRADILRKNIMGPVHPAVTMS